ncbi:UNVERIFIED_CONTAM: hypothetical protein Slati_1119800 [Sesamum latifolium]|uniref:Uncharacterized protein n=1 Tax=Sesamum latifolium TaxID=2727402 RepID=A0AAW2XBP5_9LAMI
MAARQRQEVTVCGICSNSGHPTDACPSLQEGTMPNVNAVGGFLGQTQQRYDPHSNFYNPGWRDHPNFSYRNHGEQAKPQPQIFNRPAPAQAPPQAPNLGLQKTEAGLQETRTCLNHLGNQITQLAAQSSGKLPSQTESNPRENVSAMTLGVGRNSNPLNQHRRKPKKEGRVLNTPTHILTRSCVPIRKLKDKKRIIFGKNVSAVINRKLPEKCKDPGRPFMKTAKTKIDVDDGTLSVEIDGEIVKFKISEATKYPNELQALYQIDVVDSVVHDVLEEELVGTELDLIMDLDEDDECVEFIGGVLEPSQSFGTNHTTSQTNSLQSILQAPILKLKALPNHLQSLYLGVRETSSASIFKGLLKEQDELKLHEGEVWRSGKEKTKRFHEFMKVKKQIEIEKKALFYKPRIKLTLGKLFSRWCGRFEAVNIFSHGAAKLRNLDKGNSFAYDEVGNLDDAAFTSPPQSTNE